MDTIMKMACVSADFTPFATWTGKLPGAQLHSAGVWGRALSVAPLLPASSSCWGALEGVWAPTGNTGEGKLSSCFFAKVKPWCPYLCVHVYATNSQDRHTLTCSVCLLSLECSTADTVAREMPGLISEGTRELAS